MQSGRSSRLVLEHVMLKSVSGSEGACGASPLQGSPDPDTELHGIVPSTPSVKAMTVVRVLNASSIPVPTYSKRLASRATNIFGEEITYPRRSSPSNVRDSVATLSKTLCNWKLFMIFNNPCSQKRIWI